MGPPSANTCQLLVVFFLNKFLYAWHHVEFNLHSGEHKPWSKVTFRGNGQTDFPDVKTVTPSDMLQC